MTAFPYGGATSVLADLLLVDKSKFRSWTSAVESYAGLGFPSVSALLADSALTYTPGGPNLAVAAGDMLGVARGGMTYEVAAAGASNHHAITAGGIKLYEAGPNFTSTTRLTAAIARDTTAAIGTVWRAPDAAYEKTGGGWVAQVSLSDVTTTIAGKLDDAANAVSNGNLAQMPTKTMKGNALGATGDADDLTASEVMTLLGFTMSQAIPGSLTIPKPGGGTALVIKWGFETTVTAVSFAAAFPTNILAVFATPRDPSSQKTICPVRSPTVNGFTASPQEWNGSSWVAFTGGYNWLAIGH